MRSPKTVASEQELYAAALGALTRRAHSVFEMRTYLERRAAQPDAARTVLARLREQRLLDDARYALEFARQRARTRGQGRYRIARELRARGVADSNIEAAVEQAFTETDETALVRKTIERRVRLLRGPLDERRVGSLYRSLLRGGFDAALIRRELQPVLRRAKSEAELPETEPSDEAE
jgi:regulatory protein